MCILLKNLSYVWFYVVYCGEIMVLCSVLCDVKLCNETNQMNQFHLKSNHKEKNEFTNNILNMYCG